MTTDAGEAVRFLRSLYRTEAPGYIGVWVLQTKTSYWHEASDPERCFGDIDRMASTSDVYFHVGLQASPTKPLERGVASGVIAIPGLWIDLDYQSTAHKKTNLPPDAATALAFLRSLPMQPTIIIHTGHGYQAYWLWDKLVLLDTDEKRTHAETLVRRWNRLCRNTARAQGWDVDSTWDLARIFRLPGTLNHKEGKTVAVELIEEHDERRYNYTAIDGLIPLDEQPSNGHSPVEDFKMEDGVSPPFEKFLAAMENLTNFKRSWERTRKDMQDQSGSGYDQSLANMAIAAGWTDQEVVNLLLTAARKFGDPAKRDSYYRTTLQKAHGSIGALNSLTKLDVSDPAAMDDRDEILQMLTDVFGAPVNGAIWRGRENAHMSIIIDGTEVPIGTALTMQNQVRVRAAVFEATKIMFKGFKPARWLKSLTLLAKIATVYDIPDGGPQADLEAFLIDYGRGTYFGHGEQPWGEALQNGMPFWRDGRLWINVNAFRFHLKIVHGISMESDDIRPALARVGWTPGLPKGESARVDGKPYNRKYWKSPTSWNPDDVL